jgi:putative ABC transport system ATP-binding protein
VDGVMGPSGSGKSTLLHSAGGLEKVSSGQVLVDGQDITDLSEKKLTGLRPTVIGFVFQNFNLVGSLTAEQNVAMPLKLAGQRPPRRSRRDDRKKPWIAHTLWHEVDRRRCVQ